MTRSKTLGEFRIGVNFNPSKITIVDEIKSASAALIDLILTIDTETFGEAGPERARLKAIALTHIETAAMYAVKAATKTV